MKTIPITFLFLVLTLGMVSAFGETARFDKTDGEYGSYEIKSGWGILPKFLGGGDLAWVKLTENTDSCLIDCYAKGAGYFNEPKNFLDGLEFRDKLGREEASLTGVKILVGQTETITKQKPIHKEICENIIEERANKTSPQISKSCYNKVMGYEDYTEEKIVYREYEGEEIVGDFFWEIRAKKKPGISVDWIVTIWGEELDEWAWWDSDWARKRQILIQENSGSNLTNYSVLINITYDEDMETDFGDLRFLDSSEMTELTYWIDKWMDSAWATIWIKAENLTANINNSIYVYYDNAAVNTTSDFNNTFLFSDDFENGTAGVAPAGWTMQESGGTIRVSTESAGRGNKSLKIDDTGAQAARLYGYIQLPNDMNTAAIHWSANRDGVASYSSVGLDDSTLEGSTTAGTPASSGFNGGIVEWVYYSSGAPVAGAGVPSSGWTNLSMSVNLTDYLDISQNGTSIIGVDDLNSIPDLYRYIQVWTVGGGASNHGFIDDIYIRNFVDPEPTYVIGAEELEGANIELISPENNLQTTQTVQTFGCNASFPSDIANLTLVIDGLDNFTNSTAGTFIELSHLENLSQAVYTWSCRAVTVSESITQSSNRTLTIHITIPDVTVHNPEATIDYHLIGNNLTLNWTVTETGENLTTHIKNCTYDYSGITTSVNNTVCIQTNQTNFIYALGNNSLIFNVTDILDLVNSTNVSWNIKVVEVNQTFNNETLEGAAEDFSAVIRLGQGETISAVAFVYNESATAGVSSAMGDNTEITIDDFIIPQVGAETNITFHWSIVLTGGEIINLTSQNQTVENMNVDNCSSFSNQILNISMVDEEEQFTLSNTTVEIAINLLSVDRTQTVVSLSGNFENENPLGICLNENVTESIMYSLDAIIKYTSTGYAIEYYNLVNLSLDNETETQQITLYNLNATDSTDFQLTFNGEDFLPVENALVFVERQYIAENTFKTVELPKTDSNGQTILHLVRNDIIYNIRIVKEGSVLANFLNIIAFCQDFTIGDCTLPLNAQSNTTGIFNYDDEIGILYDSPPVYDTATNTVSFDFTSTSGATKVVEMNVERRDIFGNNSVCSNTLISTSGTVSCNIGLNLTNTILFTTISIDGEEWIADTTPIDKTNYGSIGFVVWFLFAISLILMFSESKNGVMLSIAISYIGAVALGLATGTITGVGSAGIWALVITSIGIWKINKNRSS